MQRYNWQRFDPNDLNPLEDRLYFMSINTDRIELSKFVSHKISETIKPRFTNLLHDVAHSEDVIERNCRVINNKERFDIDKLKEYVNHRGCFSCDVPYYPNSSFNRCVNLRYFYTRANCSPIFSSLMSQPTCGGINYERMIPRANFFRCLNELYLLFQVNDSKSIGEYDFFDFFILRENLTFMSNMHDYAVKNLLILIFVQLFHMDIPFVKILDVMERIELAFLDKPVKMCPGFLVYAPPGTGKTHFLHTSSHFFLDTDFFDNVIMSDKPHIINNLVHSGFCVLTNYSRFDVFENQVLMFGLFVDLQIQIPRLERKGIFTDFDSYSELKKRFLTVKYRETFGRTRAKFDFYNLLRDMNVFKSRFPYIIIENSRSFAQCIEEFYAYAYFN